jgi:hypothetical protein
MRLSRLGKSHSEATRQKISDSHRGKTMSQAAKAKMSATAQAKRAAKICAQRNQFADAICAIVKLSIVEYLTHDQA